MARTLISPDNAAGQANQFGNEVTGLGNKVLIGDNQASGGGAAHLFEASTGELLHSFYNPNPNPANDNYAIEVELLENFVAIGSYATHGDTGFPGIVYVYDVVTGDLLQEIRHPFGVGDQRFGASMQRIGDNGLAIAVVPPSAGGLGPAGSVYIYSLIPIPEPKSFVLLLLGSLMLSHQSLRMRGDVLSAV